MSIIKIQDVDIIFLSYDEPNAEENWADLQRKIPWAKRVHGVEGSDAAHKACADLSDTKHFVTVDGDTIVDPKFMQVSLDLDKLGVDDDYQFSWCGKINANGLMYGNGSLKMWTKEFVKNMKTHENTDGSNETSIEFCYFDNYYQLNDNYSTSIITSTPQQAWRAGFREGVKMSLDRGKPIEDINTLWWQNRHRLYIWQMVGCDIPNGIWAVYGARLGTYMNLLTEWDHTQTRDFTYLNSLWEQHKDINVSEECKELGKKLINELDIPIAVIPFDKLQSEFFKTVYINSDRVIRRK